MAPVSGPWDEGLSWAGGQGGLPRGGGTGATSEGVWREVCGETRGTRPGETPPSQAQFHGTPPSAFPEPCEVSLSRGRPPVVFQRPALPGAAAASVPLSSQSPRQARFTDERTEHREVKTFARATQLVGGSEDLSGSTGRSRHLRPLAPWHGSRPATRRRPGSEWIGTGGHSAVFCHLSPFFQVQRRRPPPGSPPGYQPFRPPRMRVEDRPAGASPAPCRAPDVPR